MTISEAGSPPTDGREDEAAPGKPGAKPAHRHLYYRLYTKDDALESHNPIYSNDRSISRVLARSVAPPHTGDLLKRHLCRTEGFEKPGNHSLYPSLTATTTLEDSARISLRGNASPGSSESEPMALVVDISAVEKRLGASAVDPKTLPERHEEPRYVFYRVYEKAGEVAPKTSFDEADSALGRVHIHSIPPPHTVSSLKSRLVKVEEISSGDIQVFEDVYGESLLNDDDSIALSSDHYPGATEEEPIAIVYESAPAEDPAFSKKIQVKSASRGYKIVDPAWHSQTTGDIFKTDGILRQEQYNDGSVLENWSCYVAVNPAGRKAFIYSKAVDFC